LATTNRDLTAAVQKGEFREDLYYRLNVFPLAVPALRDREEDVMLLAQNFLEKFQRKHGIKPTGFSKSAISALQNHPWPGNVRELQNTIERAVILAEDGKPIEPSLLGLNSTLPKKKPATRRVAAGV
jgi:transcriptional regulator with GAF, ATPase, and Fis domain